MLLLNAPKTIPNTVNLAFLLDSSDTISLQLFILRHRMRVDTVASQFVYAAADFPAKMTLNPYMMILSTMTHNYKI
jgi:hypothetical protein